MWIEDLLVSTTQPCKPSPHPREGCKFTSGWGGAGREGSCWSEAIYCINGLISPLSEVVWLKECKILGEEDNVASEENVLTIKG
jgi:hypothetical protein